MPEASSDIGRYSSNPGFLVGEFAILVVHLRPMVTTNDIDIDWQRLYRSSYRIRRVEEEVVKAYPTDKIKSPVG